MGGRIGREQVKACLMGVSAWFDDYLRDHHDKGGTTSDERDTELHKAMLLLLCRAYEYRIKTEGELMIY